MSQENGTGEIAKALNAAKVSLRYTDGGKIQVVTVDGQEFSLPGSYHIWDIIPALGKIRSGQNKPKAGA